MNFIFLFLGVINFSAIFASEEQFSMSSIPTSEEDVAPVTPPNMDAVLAQFRSELSSLMHVDQTAAIDNNATSQLVAIDGRLQHADSQNNAQIAEAGRDQASALQQDVISKTQALNQNFENEAQRILEKSRGQALSSYDDYSRYRMILIIERFPEHERSSASGPLKIISNEERQKLEIQLNGELIRIKIEEKEKIQKEIERVVSKVSRETQRIINQVNNLLPKIQREAERIGRQVEQQTKRFIGHVKKLKF